MPATAYPSTRSGRLRAALQAIGGAAALSLLGMTASTHAAVMFMPVHTPDLTQGTTYDDYRWRDGVVHYRIMSSISGDMEAKIRAAIAQWEQSTPARFQEVPAGANLSSYEHIAQFTGESQYGCFSPGIGTYYLDPDAERFRTDVRDLKVYLPDTCPMATVTHELGHVLGLMHEHQRADRNQHIQVRMENVDDPVKQKINFCQAILECPAIATSNVGPYDIQSIMHYSRYTFARELPADPDHIPSDPQDPQHPTHFAPIWPVNAATPKVGYEETGGVIRQSDIDAINVMYNRQKIMAGGDAGKCLNASLARNFRQALQTSPDLDTYFMGNNKPGSITTDFIYTTNCADEQYNQDWHLSPQGWLLSANGHCLEAESVFGELDDVILRSCDASAQQKWTYNSTTKELRDNRGRCLMRGDWSSQLRMLGIDGHPVIVSACNTAPLAYRTWTFAKAD